MILLINVQVRYKINTVIQITRHPIPPDIAVIFHSRMIYVCLHRVCYMYV